MEANAKQKAEKELKLVELAKQEQDEYQRIIERQVKDLDRDRQKEEDKIRQRYDHNAELR